MKFPGFGNLKTLDAAGKNGKVVAEPPKRREDGRRPDSQAPTIASTQQIKTSLVDGAAQIYSETKALDRVDKTPSITTENEFQKKIDAYNLKGKAICIGI